VAPSPPIGKSPTTPEPRAVVVSLAPRGHVLVVPDLLGSELAIRDLLVWVDIVALINGAFAKLRLDGAASPVLAHAPGLVRNSYAPLVVALSDDWRVTPFAYDWRLDADTIADQLAMTVERLGEDAGSCHIVAHGFGGLVLRALMHRSPHLAQRLDRLVLLGTPNHGAVSAVQDLAGAGAFMKTLGAIDLTHSVDDLLPIVHSFTSFFQLLPAPGPDTRWARLYEARTYGDLNLPQPQLDRAKAFHLSIRNAVDPDRMVLIAGSGQATPSTVPDAGKLRDRAAYGSTPAGDGSVLVESVRLRASDGRQPPMYVVDMSHADLVTDEVALAGVLDILATGKTDRLTPVREEVSAVAGLATEVQPTGGNRPARRSSPSRTRARRK
jgi:hypothetical protein